MPGEQVLHSENAPRKVQAFLAKKSIHLAPHPLYSPWSHPCQLVPLSMLKKELAGLSLSLDKFKTQWKGFTRTLVKDEFARISRK